MYRREEGGMVRVYMINMALLEIILSAYGVKDTHALYASSVSGICQLANAKTPRPTL